VALTHRSDLEDLHRRLHAEGSPLVADDGDIGSENSNL